jgi:hypothetical protein
MKFILKECSSPKGKQQCFPAMFPEDGQNPETLFPQGNHTWPWDTKM